MYNIREQVSDKAGRLLAVYKAENGLTNSEALEKILTSIPALKNGFKNNKELVK